MNKKIKVEIIYPIEIRRVIGMSQLMVNHGEWGCYIWHLLKETKRHISYEEDESNIPYDPYYQIRKGHEKVIKYIKPFAPTC